MIRIPVTSTPIPVTCNPNELPTTADRRHFFNIAYGSLKECQAILDLFPTAEAATLELADKLGASLYRLIQNAR